MIRRQTLMGTNGIKYLKPVFNVTRDISHLPRWKQWVYWWMFVPLLRLGFKLNLPVIVAENGARLDIQSVAETDAIAAAIVASIGPSAFYAPQVPVNATLPVSPVVFGGMRAPYSDVAKVFETNGKRENVTFICPRSQTPCTQHESVKRSDVENLYHKVKSVAAS
jgi:hypothetical protein